ncbi:uncharacterized protein G2W53_028868 [Senna tora]|uniref:Ubiquitin-like protease family profile domain-containing protein n=1 Tax=Senna tora TaxID=362788 RepID=A0A834T338_9FABA|nr:uncharacterized protein G2W53_028868 [Senna tora]
MIAHVEEEKIYILDTLQHDKHYYTTVKEFVGFVINELINKNCKWAYHLVKNGPRQPDRNNCRPLMLKIMQCWAMGHLPSFPSKNDVDIARKFIIWEIAMNRVVEPWNYDMEMKNHSPHGPPKKLLILDMNGVLLHTQWIRKGKTITFFF